MNRATANAQDGISLIQTAEGALNEDASILNRLRELAIQSQSDSLTSSDRLELQKEVDQLVDEVDRLVVPRNLIPRSYWMVVLMLLFQRITMI